MAPEEDDEEEEEEEEEETHPPLLTASDVATVLNACHENCVIALPPSCLVDQTVAVVWSFPEREKRAGEDREQLVDRPSRPTGERAGRRAILEGRQPRGDDVVEDGDDEERPSKRAREDVGRGALHAAPGKLDTEETDDDERQRSSLDDALRNLRMTTTTTRRDRSTQKPTSTATSNAKPRIGENERDEELGSRSLYSFYVVVLKAIHEMVTYAPEPSRTSAAAVLENNNDGSNSNLERRVIVIVMRVVITIKATVERIA